jgi:CRP-like cAMP-binding protein
MSMVDGGPSTGTARVKEAAELSILDERKFFFMVDEVPNFALYIMRALAHRIRGLREMI